VNFKQAFGLFADKKRFKRRHSAAFGITQSRKSIEHKLCLLCVLCVKNFFNNVPP